LGWVERLNAEDNEEMYLMIEVRPEEYKDELVSSQPYNVSKYAINTLYNQTL
jgi:hypothetical protein